MTSDRLNRGDSLYVYYFYHSVDKSDTLTDAPNMLLITKQIIFNPAPRYRFMHHLSMSTFLLPQPGYR